MYDLKIETHFDAAHRLNGYEGNCSRLHGHRWKVIVSIKGNTLNDWGALVDFKEIKKIVNEVVDELDHKTIISIDDELARKTILENWVFSFGGNPTAENLAHYFYTEIGSKLEDIELNYVEVFESPTSSVKYYHESKS